MPRATAKAPSRDPVVDKAQHDPHFPWFLTGVTFSATAQSKLSTTTTQKPYAP